MHSVLQGEPLAGCARYRKLLLWFACLKSSFLEHGSVAETQVRPQSNIWTIIPKGLHGLAVTCQSLGT